MVSATNGLYWGFNNIQYRRHGLSRLCDNDFFYEDRNPILECKFLSKKVRHTRKYGISCMDIRTGFVQTHLNLVRFEVSMATECCNKDFLGDCVRMAL
jgi:hypothetical protein